MRLFMLIEESFLLGFDCQEFNIYRMTVAYVSMNCSSVSFEIVRKKSSDQTIDLGMAFINVPTNVYPAVMIRPPKRKNVNSKTTTVTMEYYSGSWNPGNCSYKRMLMPIGIDFGGSPGTCPQLLRNIYAFISYCPLLLPPNILVAPNIVGGYNSGGDQ